jgi:hypothetical protein
MTASILFNSMLSSLALSWKRKLNSPYGSAKKSIIRAGGADGTVAWGEVPGNFIASLWDTTDEVSSLRVHKHP